MNLMPDCETCDDTGIVYPPALFGEPVPDDAGELCPAPFCLAARALEEDE